MKDGADIHIYFRIKTGNKNKSDGSLTSGRKHQGNKCGLLYFREKKYAKNKIRKSPSNSIIRLLKFRSQVLACRIFCRYPPKNVITLGLPKPSKSLY